MDELRGSFGLEELGRDLKFRHFDFSPQKSKPDDVAKSADGPKAPKAEQKVVLIPELRSVILDLSAERKLKAEWDRRYRRN
ncbi:MAG: hypothetical protein HY220_04285 [Candidatus Sungbacteria bacterium]|uniref:Uncharacterized protein n=1 Tax=Candidatus Sungiibacteriota bacterium TaxID=2750080 RepID=A0A9D6LQM6_9BACT|nr:hypothetical protein [Candidatus Sungbacteria bacterium]